MCGRYTLYSSKEEVEAFFNAHAEDDHLFQQNYNVAPGTTMPVVLNGRSGKREIGGLRWGLIPRWADDVQTGYKMINARAETLSEKKSFREPFKKQRCIIPANGFYEWKKEQQQKQPFYIRVLTYDLIGFAGLYEKWTSPEGVDIYSYTIITTEANSLVKPLHDRMPVILDPESYDSWLDKDNRDTDSLQNLLQPYGITKMGTYRVTEKVNNTKNNYSKLIQPIPK